MTVSPNMGYAAARLFRTAFPKLVVSTPPPGIRVERNVAIAMRDGTILRANVFRPAREGKFPVLMCAHPYGKDDMPIAHLPPKRYRFMRQPEPVTFSSYTSWEAPDPGYWVPRGYALVNLDLRGFGRSEGIGTLLSDGEAADYAEAIEWAAAQPWSSGKIGLNGVSYLAVSQWKVAALRPKSLVAICPWEGWTDIYRDLAFPGGVREDGFLPFWAGMTERAGHVTESLRAQQLAHPEFDDFWASRMPALERIEVPALICASFSDHGLHSRGCFEAFRRIGSKERFLYTHRSGKWSTYYSADALALQSRFFDCFLKGEDNGMRRAAPVRLEARSRADVIHSVREERAWPLPGLRWTAFYLAPGTLRSRPLATRTSCELALPNGAMTFDLRIAEDLELVGPMKLRLHVELRDALDGHLFVAVSKIARASGREVPFEGSSGFGCDVVAKGWQRLAHRRLDESRNEPFRPYHLHDRVEPFRSGEIVPVEIEILPSATYFAHGDTLRLQIQGRWFWRRSMLRGMFPFTYAPSGEGMAILHFGDEHDAHLLVPQT